MYSRKPQTQNPHLICLIWPTAHVEYYNSCLILTNQHSKEECCLALQRNKISKNNLEIKLTGEVLNLLFHLSTRDYDKEISLVRQALASLEIEYKVHVDIQLESILEIWMGVCQH